MSSMNFYGEKIRREGGREAGREGGREGGRERGRDMPSAGAISYLERASVEEVLKVGLHVIFDCFQELLLVKESAIHNRKV
jgi:predicted transposase YdaD